MRAGSASLYCENFFFSFKRTRRIPSMLYVRDRQLKVTKGPIFGKLKSSGPKHRKKKVIQNMNFN
jgi:hypothetical protein